jgi:hypothetical protein
MNTQTEKPAVLVVEIPAGLSTGNIQDLVNASVQDDSYYFAGAAAYACGLLAFFRLRVEKTLHEKPLPNEDVALAVLKAHPRLSCAKMTAMLRARGFPRTAQWVLTRRAEVELNTPGK